MAQTQTHAEIDGKKVKVGDSVGFKCDYEQIGQIKEIKIERDWIGNPKTVLVLTSGSMPFGGGYIGGQRETEMELDRCWTLDY